MTRHSPTLHPSSPTKHAKVLEFALRDGHESGRKLRIASSLKGGRYQIIDILADGGMGVLYRARDLRVGGNLVLIKSVKYNSSMFGYSRDKALYHVYAMRQRFKREKNILMEMAHRGLNNVPSLNDFFYDENPELQRAFLLGRCALRSPYGSVSSTTPSTSARNLISSWSASTVSAYKTPSVSSRRRGC